MVIVMNAHATDEEIDAARDRVEALGFQAHLSRGSERTIIGVIGDERPVEPEVFEALPGVERVVRILHPAKLASRDFHPADRVIELPNGARLGGPEVSVMAGPCAVESREQLLTTARAVKAAGAKIVRGGAYKPRTSPYSFQGMKEQGLELLSEARAETGLPVITEIVDTRDVDAVLEHADILQVGARNMQNFALLEVVGHARKPVLLKRGLSATIQEWLMAAEYIVAKGNYQVILCERGIRTFETMTRNTLDLGAIPLIKRMTHLPIIVDPSHGTGDYRSVPALARAAAAVGADGLMIEVHPDPARALSDGDRKSVV